MTLSGAIVATVSRSAQLGIGDVEHEAQWHADFNQLLTAYEVVKDLDLRIVMIHLAKGGVPFLFGTDTHDSMIPREFDNLLPSWLLTQRVVNVDGIKNAGGSAFPSQLDPLPGWVPDHTAYTHQFDNRTSPGGFSNVFVPKFGHAPKDFLICADTGILNEFDLRIAGSIVFAQGLVALGISNDTVKLMVKREGPGFTGVDNQGFKNNAFRIAISAIKMKFETPTESCEFSQRGYVLGIDDEGRPEAKLKFDTVFGAMARQLERVAELNGLT